MIFPNSYGRDQPDGPDQCDECEGTGEVELVMGDGYSFGVIVCPECGGTGQV